MRAPCGTLRLTMKQMYIFISYPTVLFGKYFGFIGFYLPEGGSGTTGCLPRHVRPVPVGCPADGNGTGQRGASLLPVRLSSERKQNRETGDFFSRFGVFS